MVCSNLRDAKFQTFQILFGVLGDLNVGSHPVPCTPHTVYIYLFGFVHMAFRLTQRYVPVPELFYPLKEKIMGKQYLPGSNPGDQEGRSGVAAIWSGPFLLRIFKSL
jgi:hypothetical protein